MPNFDDNSYSNGKLIIIFITPLFILFIGVLLGKELEICLCLCIIFYIAFWILKEEKDITQKRIVKLMENNILSAVILNSIEFMRIDDVMPEDLKNDLFKVYLDIANNILYYDREILNSMTKSHFDYDLKHNITTDDISDYNEMMKTLCVTPFDIINTNNWDSIEKATMLSIHYNIYDTSLLSKYVNKKPIISFINHKCIDEYHTFWDARELMYILGYKSWEEFKPVIDIAKEKLIDSDFIYIGDNNYENYELSSDACKSIVENAEQNKPEIQEMKKFFRKNLETIEWGCIYRYANQ